MTERDLRLLYVCTGNAARSVMATAMTRARTSGVEVRGAGTLSIPGLPMSSRTRAALAELGLSDSSHRSNQLEEIDMRWADLVVVFEPQHLGYIRTNHPSGAAKSASLPRLVQQLPDDERPLVDRVAALGLDELDIEPWEEVVDPAGGDQDVFHACAREVSDLIDAFHARARFAGPAA